MRKLRIGQHRKLSFLPCDKHAPLAGGIGKLLRIGYPLTRAACLLGRLGIDTAYT